MPISSTILISKFVDLNSQMVAQQLTWAEHKIYCTIHPQLVHLLHCLLAHAILFLYYAFLENS